MSAGPAAAGASVGAPGARPSLARTALTALPLGFLGVFFVWPVAAIVGRGLAPGGHLDLSPLGRVATDSALRGIAWFTVWQAAASTLLTVALGLPVAFVLSRLRFPGRGPLRAAVTVPFVLPTVVVASAFTALLGTGGPLAGLGLDGTVWPILLAHAFFNLAVVVRTVGGLWTHLDPQEEEAARVLGASRVRAWREVTLPALRPAIGAAASIVFLFCFTSFGVILLLGGPARATLETEIYRQTVERLDLPQAAALSLVQLGAVVAVLLVGDRARGLRAAAVRLRAAAETAHPLRGFGERALLGGVLVELAVLLGLPIGVLVARSFATSPGPGLAFYRALGHTGPGSVFLDPPLHAVVVSLRAAAVATMIAATVGASTAFILATSRGRGRRVARAFDTFVMLPLGISAVTVGFGFLIALDRPPLDLRTSPLIVPIAQAVVAVPIVVRTMLPVLEAVDPHLREAAALLGATPARVWQEIDLPIVARAALLGAAFAFAVSLGEFGATLFVVRPDQPTLPVAIYRLLGRPGAQNLGQAMALSTILMLLTALAVGALERLRLGSLGEF